MSAADVGDEMVLKDNGTVRLMLGGKGYTLRRCTLGSYRKLKELWTGVIQAQEAERERKKAEAADEYAKAHKGTKPPEDWEPVYGAEANAEYDMFLRESVAGWAVECFRLLCDGDPPGLDDMPAWTGNIFFAQKLFAHWLNVPLVPSSP